VTGGRREVTKVVAPVEMTAEVVEEPVGRYGALVPVLRRDENV
jgi:hypothetical protein